MAMQKSREAAVGSAFIIPSYPYPSCSFLGIILSYPSYSLSRFLTILSFLKGEERIGRDSIFKGGVT